ncbi:MAG: hypothetical protein QM610_15565 [Chitinophagaceae bacterium]
MKLFTILSLLPVLTFSQKTIVPGVSDINIANLKQGKSLYTNYYVKDKDWKRMGSLTYDIGITGNRLSVVFSYFDSNNVFIRRRTSVADAATLTPVSYKFEGLQNTFDIDFGTTVTGLYRYTNKAPDSSVTITPTGKYFDFNIADNLFCTLPLDVGYKATIPEFYYTGKSKPVSNYAIKEVKSYVHYSPKTGNHDAWLVSVLEESTGAVYYYTIDKKDHRLWQREMPLGNGMWEIFINEELDYQPIKNRFNKEEALAKVHNGNSSIIGTAYARDHAKRGVALLNINKAQYAPKGTKVSLLPNSPYIEEWKEVNEKIRKKKKMPEVPIDPNVPQCIQTTEVYDDKGHFEFTNLMPGEYIVMTSFDYTHRYSYQYYAGTSYLMHPSGAVLSSSPVYNTASASTGATANIETKVTIDKDGDKVKMNLKDTR